MTEHKSIAEALAAFQAEMPAVSKSKRAEVPTKSGGRYTYTYADLASITDVAMPLLTSHGLAFTCSPRSGERGYELVATLLHTSGEHIDGSLPIGGDTPQALGSSLTYMRRYLLGCLTGIVTEDDDDGKAASAPAKRTRAAQPPPEDGPPAQTRTMSRPPRRESGVGISVDQSKALHASFNDVGITDREMRLAYCRNLIGRQIETSNDLTRAEASAVINALKADLETPFEEPQP
jgi:hypothetical protein